MGAIEHARDEMRRVNNLAPIQDVADNMESLQDLLQDQQMITQCLSSNNSSRLNIDEEELIDELALLSIDNTSSKANTTGTNNSEFPDVPTKLLTNVSTGHKNKFKHSIEEKRTPQPAL